MTMVEMHYSQMLCGSVTSISTTLNNEDEILIDNTTPADDSFWGR